MRTGQASEEDVKQRRERAMQDPEVQRILTDPVMRQASYLSIEYVTLLISQTLREANAWHHEVMDKKSVIQLREI